MSDAKDKKIDSGEPPTALPARPVSRDGDPNGTRLDRDIYSSHLSSRKLELEVRQLEQHVSLFDVWSKRIGALVAVGAALVALFAGIYQFSKATEESRLKRLNDERSEIAKSFELLSSPYLNDIARGSIGLILYADSPEHRENIYAGLKSRLAALMPPPTPEKIVTRTEHRRFESAQIQALAPLIERFPLEKQNELYATISQNTSLKYGRLAALEHLKASKEQWKRALSDEDEELVEAAIIAIAKQQPPFAGELLIDVLDKPGSIKISAAARALGELRAAPAADKLMRLLENPSEYIRRPAAEALAKIGDKRAIEPLRSALAREQDEETRAVLRMALGQLGGGDN